MWLLIIVISITNNLSPDFVSLQTVQTLEFSNIENCLKVRDTIHKLEKMNTTIDLGCFKK